MKYDIIIPTIYRDYPFLNKVIKYVIQNLTPENIYIITNGEKSKYISKSIINNPKCTIRDENRLIDGMDFCTIKHLLAKRGIRNRPGWYYQQFLKMGFSLSKFAQNDYYLSWDSDTLPLRPLKMFDTDGSPFFTMKNEYHQPYFDTIYRLIEARKINKKSFIAENMMFNKTIMKELIGEIENSKAKSNKWFEKIILSIDEGEEFGFSEFETYGTYCLQKHPNLYHERELSCFRLGGYIQGRLVSTKILKALSYDLDIISFEPTHIPPFPWSIINNMYYYYLRKKERVIDKFLHH